ncbi:MAG: hypothetical protein QOG53_1558 [Frankiales bacterium]|nr:hypothetical protein [Frankiales bacterium]
MNANQAKHGLSGIRISRVASLFSVFTGAVLALMCNATVALAQVPKPDPTGSGQAAGSSTTIVTHSSSGFAMWSVLLIAAGAIALGVALTELVHSVRRHGQVQRLATA